MGKLLDLATPLQLGQRVEFKSLTSERVFRGNLLTWIDTNYAWVTDGTGRPPRPVRRERLRHIGGS